MYMHFRHDFAYYCIPQLRYFHDLLYIKTIIYTCIANNFKSANNIIVTENMHVLQQSSIKDVQHQLASI